MPQQEKNGQARQVKWNIPSSLILGEDISSLSNINEVSSVVGQKNRLWWYPSYPWGNQISCRACVSSAFVVFVKKMYTSVELSFISHRTYVITINVNYCQSRWQKPHREIINKPNRNCQHSIESGHLSLTNCHSQPHFSGNFRLISL